MSTDGVLMRWKAWSPWGPAGILAVGLLAATGLFVAAVASADELAPECATAGETLQEAKDRYADECQLPRIDCDPIDGVWYCSSRVIGSAAPGGVSADDVGSSDITGGTLVVTTPTTAAPPTSGQPTTTAKPPTTEPTTTTAPTSNGACGIVAIEAESLDLVGDWKVVRDSAASGGAYITWEGLKPSANNGSPDDIISTRITIRRPGSYRFTWAMRQPDGVDSDKANDSWLDFPDADRFGPTSGGDYPGFIKVFGNAKGEFAYRARADVRHEKSTIAVEFDRPGSYTLRLAGRSHGHQIDRIIIHHSSIDQADAIVGRGGDCDTTTTTAPTTSSTAPTTTPTTKPSTTTNPGSCRPGIRNGAANLSRDLISLHYDHAPDKDDAHAAAAGKEVATRLGFTPWVIGGAYGADNANTYKEETEPVMDAIWSSGGWINADADWDRAVRRTADRWQETLDACGDIWIAEGGQSDLSADVVRELKRRRSGLDTKRRIHLVQHSGWNERMALDADLAYVKAETDYIKIADGNGGGNGTADFNDEKYRGPFIETALNGPNRGGWRAAFDYYSPQEQRLDFSDTVELLRILDIGTDQVRDIEDFADRFMR